MAKSDPIDRLHSLAKDYLDELEVEIKRLDAEIERLAVQRRAAIANRETLLTIERALDESENDEAAFYAQTRDVVRRWLGLPPRTNADIIDAILTSCEDVQPGGKWTTRDIERVSRSWAPDLISAPLRRSVIQTVLSDKWKEYGWKRERRGREYVWWVNQREEGGDDAAA